MKQQIKQSFLNVKADINGLQDNVAVLESHNNDLREKMEVLRTAYMELSEVVLQMSDMLNNTELVASRSGKRVHTTKCPFTENIKEPRSFESVAEAMTMGYTACACV
jgi:hypothetical protein